MAVRSFVVHVTSCFTRDSLQTGVNCTGNPVIRWAKYLFATYWGLDIETTISGNVTIGGGCYLPKNLFTESTEQNGELFICLSINSDAPWNC